MKITKAIIPVAGWGTRRLPITKTIEKCVLPIGNRPLVDYIVEDCLKAGLTELIFVVSEGSTQLQDYYSTNEPLNNYLIQHGKADKLPLVAPPAGVTLRYVVQSAGGKYGTAVPVGLVADDIAQDEAAVVLMGDDFMWNSDGSSEVARLMQAAETTGAAMTSIAVGQEDVSRYGVLRLGPAGEYRAIVEKPRPEDAPSNLISVGKYVLPKRVFELARDIAPNPVRGEYELPDALNQYVAEGGVVAIHRAQGQFLDGGSVEGWLHANNVVCGS